MKLKEIILTTYAQVVLIPGAFLLAGMAAYDALRDNLTKKSPGYEYALGYELLREFDRKKNFKTELK